MRIRLLPRFAWLPLLLAACAAHAQASVERVLEENGTTVRIVVEGVDDPARVEVLQRWAAEAARATLTASGRFPLDAARARIVQRESDDASAVPWGQTVRRDGVTVVLVVRADAGADALRADWTAVHEFAHLFHPFLGGDGRWMAEGLASYWQNVLRARAGLLAPDEAWRRLDAGFARGRHATGSGGAVPLSALRGRGATMRVYWAGAAYWLQADLALRARGSSLDAVFDAWTRCCLRKDAEMTPLAFAHALDRIDGRDLFARLWREHANATTFPDLAVAYATLGLHTDDGTLSLDPDPRKRRLRDAIMQDR